MVQQCLEISPTQINFRNVVLGKVYSQLIAITNRSNTIIEATIRPSSLDRYSVHPKHLKLKGGQTCEVDLRLKVTRFGQTEKAVHQGHRDAIHVKTAHFSDQQFFVHFFLDPDELARHDKAASTHRPPLLANEVICNADGHRGPSDNQASPVGQVYGQDDANQGGRVNGKEHASIRLQAPASPPSPVHQGALQRIHGVSAAQAALDEDSMQVSMHGRVQKEIQTALAAERAMQEQRSQKVLHVLQDRDKIIHELHVEHGRLHAKIQALEKRIEEANQQKVAAQRAAKAAEAQLHDLRMEKLTTSEQWKEKFTMREMELSNQIQTLQAAATAVEEEKAKQASTIDQELKMVQKQLHQTRVDALASEEQKLKAEAENEALKRRVAASDDLASDLRLQIQQCNATSSTHLARLQTEHQQALEDLQAQVAALQAVALREGTIEDPVKEPNLSQEELQEDANKLLQDRVLVLEAANASLEEALIHGSAMKMPETLPRHRDTSLTMPSTDGTDSQTSNALVPLQRHVQPKFDVRQIEPQRLAEIIVNKDKEVAAQQVRVAKLESLHKLAQDSALACESELVSCHQALLAVRQENQSLVSELQNSKILAAQLNSRITHLLAMVASRPSDGGPMLDEVKQAHTKEVAALQQEAQRLLKQPSPINKEHGNIVKLVNKALGSSVVDGDPGDDWSQRGLEDACTDAEAEVTRLQQQLVIGECARVQAENDAKSAARSTEALRSNLEQKISMTANDGQLQVQLLEEKIQRLINRGDDQAELTRLSADASKLRQENAQLKSELLLSQERVQKLTLKPEVAHAEFQDPAVVHAHGVRSAISHKLNQPENGQLAQEFHRITARLVERAETAEMELAARNVDLNMLKADLEKSAVVDIKGPGANVAASRAIEAKARGVEQDATLKRYGAMSLEEAMQATKILQLQNALTEAAREAAAARRRVSAAVWRAESSECTAQMHLMSKLKELRSQVSCANTRAFAAEAGKRNAQEAAKQWHDAAQLAKAEVAKKQHEIDVSHSQLKSMKAQLDAAEREACEAAQLLEQKLSNAEAVASERAMQLSVLTDTVEALQSREYNDQNQRIINLTAQLVASRGCEASQRSRSNDLLDVSSRCLNNCVLLEHERDVKHLRCENAEAELKSLRSKHESVLSDRERLQAQVQCLDSEIVLLKQENEAGKQRLVASEAESEALQLQLTKSTRCHFEQQQQLRKDIHLKTRCDYQSILTALPQPKYLQDFCAQIEECVSADRKGSSGCMWKDRFVDRLQELVLAADRDRCASVTEAHIARDEASAVVSRLQAIERSHELAQQRACICAHQVSVITAKFRDAGHQAEAHISELKTIFEARITDIQDQLSHAQAQVQTMAGSLQSAAESEQERHKEVQALSDERRHLSSQLECAVAERDAMRMQLAGHTSAVSMGLEEAVAARDAEMKDYLCSHVSALLRLGQDGDQLSTLAKELAAAKLSESQLLANIAASDKRCDAHIIRAKHLEAELRRYQLQEQCVSLYKVLWPHLLLAPNICHVSELQQQITRKDQEVSQLQYECVELRQQCERHRLQLQNLSDVSAQHKQEVLELHQGSEAAIAAACKDLKLQKQALEAEIGSARQTAEVQQASIRQQEDEWQKRLDDCQAQLQQAQENALHAQAAMSAAGNHEDQIAQLAQELSKAYTEVSELHSKLDSRDGSIKLLENGLAAIERRCIHAPADAKSAKVAYNAFTKQILQSSTAQADAHNRLKVAARETLEYQQRLVEQSNRIQDLKRVCDSCVGDSSQRSVTADRGRNHKLQAMSIPPGRIPGTDHPAHLNTQEGEIDSNRGQKVHGHIALARKDAEIDCLKRALASATLSVPETKSNHSGQALMPTSLAQEDKKLLDLNYQCMVMLSQALGNPDSEADENFQSCDHLSIGKRLHFLCKQAVAQLSDAMAEPQLSNVLLKRESSDELLVESQRSVITSLTTRNQKILHLLATAQHENGRLRERLRVFRASIGDYDQHSSDHPHLPTVDSSLPDLMSIVLPPGSQSEDSFTESHGLAVLLQNQLNTILQHQRQLTESLETQNWNGSSPDDGCVDQQVLLLPLQESARELAAMEATLQVLHHAINQRRPKSSKNLYKEEQGQASVQREPLQPLADHTPLTDNQEVSDANDDLQANQRDLYSDELHQDLRVARLRTRELEHDCRKLRRIVDETELLQSQLEQTSQECVEWQRRHTDLQQDSHRCSTTAAAEKIAMQTEIHELQMSISDTKKSMQSKIAQLEEQITVLKADKSAAVQKCEQISAEWTEAKCRVSEEHVAVERMQLQLQDQSRVVKNMEIALESSNSAVASEKEERMKLIESLRGTIEQVKAAGHEEERLHGELVKLTNSLAQERHLREQREQEVATHQQDIQDLKRELSKCSVTLLESQKLAQDKAMMAQKRVLDLDNQVHSLHEQLNMAESAFARRLDDLSQSILSVSQHMQFPREFIEEMDSLDKKVGVLGTSLEHFFRDSVQANKVTSQRKLDAERVHMQKELIDLQAQLQDCQKLAENEQMKLKGQLDIAQKESRLAQSQMGALEAHISQLEQQVLDQATAEEAACKDMLQRHHEQLLSVQEGHDAIVSSVHSASHDLQLQVNSLLQENAALLARVKAAEDVAASRAREASQVEAGLREDKQALQEKYESSVACMESQLEQMQRQFAEYKHAKHQEICGLDARIRDLLAPQSTGDDCRADSAVQHPRKVCKKNNQTHESCLTHDTMSGETFSFGMEGLQDKLAEHGEMSPTAPINPSHTHASQEDGCTTAGPTNIGLAAARDAILAAKRESKFEMMARANAETELEAAQRDNCQHRRTEQKLRSELKEAGALAQLVPGFEEQLKRQVEETNSLQTTVCQLQTTLKECKAEMSRKVSRLKAMQDKEKRDELIHVQLKEERKAHAITTSKLDHAHQALKRKSTMLIHMRQSAKASEAHPNMLTESSEQKLKQVKDLQAAVSRKDELLKQMRASRDACKGAEGKLEKLQQAHNDEVSKLRNDLNRKQALLVAAKVQTDELQSKLQGLEQDCEEAREAAAHRCQLTDARHIRSQKVGHALLNATIVLCRMLLRSTAYMRSGSISICNMSLAAQGGKSSPTMADFLPDDVADLVGFSIHEVVDLMGKSSEDLTASVAGGSATVAHVARLLTAVHEVVHSVGRGAVSADLPPDVRIHLGEIIAVMQAESRKSESSLDSCIGSFPLLASACAQRSDARDVVHRMFSKMTPLGQVTDQLDQMLIRSLDFCVDDSE